MADIRFKDLTTTASSTASDDFIAVDGTTNGTRKLSAFSPTFGGNATVTGNLTVNTALSVTNGVSANELTCTGGYAVLRGFGGSADTGALYLGQSTNNNFISSNLTTMASYIANTAITSTVAAGFRVLTTTASTSTSSGALVVSGGVGVAGKVTSTALGLANTSQSATAWGDVGVQLSVAGAVLTDTSSSGTVGRIVTNSIAASALAASSTTTYTAAASLFIAGAPTANTNVTITNAYALYTAGGRINFQGLPTSSAGLQAGTLWNDGGTLKVA